MSENNYWLLPEGITEALPQDAQALESLRRKLLDLYACWGYQLVMPPLVEFIESLSAGTGGELDLQTFKLTDQESGRLMGIRADITPQVARIDAHQMRVDHPNRLCYAGAVLRTRGNHANAGSRSPIQIGAELFGHSGLDSDLEVISLAIETVQHCRVGNIVLDLGHVGVFSRVCQQLEFSAQDEYVFSDMLSRKSMPEIEQWIDKKSFNSADAAILRQLPELNGSIDILADAKGLFSTMSSEIQETLTYLQKLCTQLQTHFPHLVIHLDLAELRGYSYHTGVVFQLYSQGIKREVIRGGRYDGIGKMFGNARPATGFSTNLRLLSRLSCDEEQISDTETIAAPTEYDSALMKLINNLRSEGHRVIRQLENGEHKGASQIQCNKQIVKQDSVWIVKELNEEGRSDG